MKRDAIYPPGHLLAGTVYRIVKLIGAGGMGTVYEVEDTTVGKHYVLKTLHAELGGREDLAVRMEREARVLAKLAHPNIVEVVTAGVTKDEQNLRYFLMEKLDGFSLRPILRHTGPLGLNRFYTIGVHLFSALKHAHANDVVHRDVKPENIFLCRGGDGQHFAKLLDFGIFTSSAPNYATQPGLRFVGTHKYAAPEQLKGRERVSGKTDVYAGGVVLYEMLAGHHPFDNAEGDIAVAAAHLHTEPPPIGTWRELPPALQEIVHRCLAKNADARPHAHEVADILKGMKREWEAMQPSDHSGRVTARDEITQTSVATGGVGAGETATEPDALIFARGVNLSEVKIQFPGEMTVPDGRPLDSSILDLPPRAARGNEMPSSLSGLPSIDPHAMTKSAPPSASAPPPEVSPVSAPVTDASARDEGEPEGEAPESERDRYVDPDRMNAFLDGDPNWATQRMNAVESAQPHGSDYGVARSVDPNAPVKTGESALPTKKRSRAGVWMLAASVGVLLAVIAVVRFGGSAIANRLVQSEQAAKTAERAERETREQAERAEREKAERAEKATRDEQEARERAAEKERVESAAREAAPVPSAAASAAEPPAVVTTPKRAATAVKPQEPPPAAPRAVDDVGPTEKGAAPPPAPAATVKRKRPGAGF